MFIKRAICIIVSYMLVMASCKPRQESLLSSDPTEVNAKDYNGFIVAIEKYKNDALNGGYIQNIIQPDSAKSRDYKQIMARLTQLAREKQMPHIVRLANISRAETLYKLGDREFSDGLPQTIAGMTECQFPIPCMTMMAEFYTTANLDAEATLAVLNPNSTLANNIAKMDEPQMIKKAVEYKFKAMQTYALFINRFSNPDNISNFGVSTNQFYESNVAIVRTKARELIQEYQGFFERHMSTSEAFGNAIISEYKNDNGQALTLADLNAETRSNVVKEAHIYRSELTQLYITLNAIDNLYNRFMTKDPGRYFRSMVGGNNLESQGKLVSLTMFSTYEASIPTRYDWRDAVRRIARDNGPEFAPIAETASNLVQSVEDMFKSFVAADPYLSAQERSFNLTSYMMQRAEREIIAEEPSFQSFPYQILRLKAKQQNLNTRVEALKGKSQEEIKRSFSDVNFTYAKADVQSQYMHLMCTWSISSWRNASSAVRAQGRNYREHIPPYECKPSEQGFSFKEGTWKYADSECRSHAYVLKERDICGTGTSYRGLRARIDQAITDLEKKKIWDPVITKAIILGAAAVSIIVTMGASSVVMGSIAGGTAAAGSATAATAVQISFAARAGLYILQAAIGSAIFTITNNVILLATGVKQINGQFWSSLGKEFLLGFVMMLFLPLGAYAGEALAARATHEMTKGFLRQLTERGIQVGVDATFFLPMVPASIAILNLLDGTPGRTWNDLKGLDTREEVLISLLFALGLRMNLKQAYYQRYHSFKGEYIGKGTSGQTAAPKVEANPQAQPTTPTQPTQPTTPAQPTPQPAPAR